MTGTGRLLVRLQPIAAILIAVATVLGYVAGFRDTVIGPHIWIGFGVALVAGFTHAMTMFYFAGIGVSLRQAAGGRKDLGHLLERAGMLRRRIATPLGLALVTVMAATILGAGSHTRRLPPWPHHSFSLAALALNLVGARIAYRAILEQEAIVEAMNHALRDEDAED